jgi:hypothetical protein
MEKALSLKLLLALLAFFSFNIATANERIGTLMVQLTYDGGYYSIQNTWSIAENYPIKSGAVAGRDWLVFQLTDGDGNELTRIKVPDPSIVRGPLLSPEETERMGLSTPHHVVQKKRGSLVLRLPQYRDMRYLNLLNPQVDQTLLDTVESGSRSVGVQQMDLLNY